MKSLIIIILTAFFLVSCSSDSDLRLKSVHFKEGKFENINPVEFHSFWEMVWAGLTNDVERATWPESIEANADKNPVNKVNGTNIRITFINHASFLIQTAGLNILTDPVFSERTSPFSFIGPKRIHKPGIDINDLPKVDMIIISHDHYDHLDLDSIEQLIKRDDPQIFMGLGVGSRLSSSNKIIELDWWEAYHVTDSFKLWFLDVQHFSGRTLTDRNTTLWGGYLLQINGQQIYFGGDSGYADHYKRTYERFGSVDVAFLPIGAYSPRAMFKPIHLNPYEAVQAHLDIQAQLSIGMHFGTFQLSAESLTEPKELLEKAKQEANIAPSSFITLEAGKPFDLIYHNK